MGPSSTRRVWPFALALASLVGCAEAPTPAYTRPMSPAAYGYPQAMAPAPAWGYGAMTCGNGPALYNSVPVLGASYGQREQRYAPVYCPVGFIAGAQAPRDAAPALWTFPASAHPASASSEAPAFGTTSGSVTIYTSAGCGPCKSLQHKLSDRNIPFLAIDVDQNRDAYLRAQVASGGKSGVPLTDINQGSQDVWILGDDADAVERAYRQN